MRLPTIRNEKRFARAILGLSMAMPTSVFIYAWIASGFPQDFKTQMIGFAIGLLNLLGLYVLAIIEEEG